MNSTFCEASCLGKIHRSAFPSTLNEYPTPLHLMHTDLWDSSLVPSSNGYLYFIFVDDYTTFTWIYLLRNKSEALQVYCNFKAEVELQLGISIKNIQSKWGGECRASTDFLTTNWIHHRISCRGAHQQKGATGGKHRHTVEIGLALLAQASMPIKYWDEAFNTSVYLITSCLHLP